MIQAYLSNQFLVLFLILAIGLGIGQLSYRGFSLGPVGVLFTAMVFGHFGYKVPKEVTDLGLLLFVYAIGLTAGPSFFRTFRRHGIRFVTIALAITLGGALVTVLVAYFLKIPYPLAAGLYTGALTNTPALAGAIDAVSRVSSSGSGLVSVGYGIAYPLSMVGVVLLIQFLPRLTRVNLREEEKHWEAEKRSESPGLEARQFRITNPNCDGKTVSEINPHRLTQANISRVKHGEQVFAATPDTILHLGDVVMVVGAEDELAKMQIILGEETQERMDLNANVLAIDVDVLEASMTGKKLSEMRVWERYTVVITRIRRYGEEIAPTGAVTLEMGDNIRVVGDKAAVESFTGLVHGSKHKADETNMLPFLTGLFLGVLVGSIVIPLPNGMLIKLGSAGGAFIVGLLIGHFGGIGPLKLYVPSAARNVLRELGLMLFLAGAGVSAGELFLDTLGRYGWSLLAGGALVTIFAVLAGLLLMIFVYRMNLLGTMGTLSGSMTNPPGLAAAHSQTTSELPTLYYATVYPVALIFKILLAQILVEVLRLLLQ
jgi:putative transport protein